MPRTVIWYLYDIRYYDRVIRIKWLLSWLTLNSENSEQLKWRKGRLQYWHVAIFSGEFTFAQFPNNGHVSVGRLSSKFWTMYIYYIIKVDGFSGMVRWIIQNAGHSRLHECIGK